MERRGTRKGTVTPLSSVLPAEQARKAAKRVAEAISTTESELNNLKFFASENANLINLVKRLPNELHHDIMVPFGKAAFFPGRLIHTNEFLVLLGENYFAERTSKQTVDILKRRGKALDSQVNALEGMIKDHKVEASFFNSTAAEAEEGLLEIREECIEEDFKETTNRTGLKIGEPATSRPHNTANVASDDEESARMFARMDELLIAEEKGEEVVEEEEVEDEEEDEEEDEDEEEEEDNDKDPLRMAGHGDRVPEEQLYNCDDKTADKLKMGISGSQSSLKGESSSKKDLLHGVTGRATQRTQERYQTATLSNYKASMGTSEPEAGTRTSKPTVDGRRVRFSEDQPDAASASRISKSITDSQKAFTGSIIEHADNLPRDPTQQTFSQPSVPQSSKPVSRFKMQRR